MSMQDTASGVALWRQVADGVERGIAEGRFAAGGKLPGETEIAETYRVNRPTVPAAPPPPATSPGPRGGVAGGGGGGGPGAARPVDRRLRGSSDARIGAGTWA